MPLVEREMLCIHEHKKNNKKAGVKGGWAVAQSPILNTTITLKRLKQRGYQSLTDVYIELNPSLCEPPSTVCPDKNRDDPLGLS